MGLFDQSPRVCCIPTGTSFVDALAYGLMAETKADPLRLSAMTVLLPNRRACRAMQEAFLRLGASGGRALMLPRLMPLGDLDEGELSLQGLALDLSLGEGLDDAVPQAIPPLRRQMLLAQLVQGAAAAALPGNGMPLDQAVRLAADLTRLFDQIETERLDFAAIRNLAPEELAEHWQLTLRFLDILRESWPEILKGEDAVDPARRRNLLLESQCRLWQERPPQDPVIAAGSTGSIPATADLIATIAGLPQGLVVLPGLDGQVDTATWQAITDDPAHPQCGLAQLLARLAVAPADVWQWPHSMPEMGERAAPPTRGKIVRAAMLPAPETRDWPKIAAKLGTPAGLAASAWRQVERVDCRSEHEEAGIIALMLREAVAMPAPYRAALVTPDRGLARRVAAELRRWGIAIDDSAGMPLTMTQPGMFFNLAASVMADDLAPAPLLALLKHPISAGGLAHDHFQAQVRSLERHLLRGPRPAPGIAGMRAVLASAACADETRAGLSALLDRLATVFALAGDWQKPMALTERLERHIKFVEALAARPDSEGADNLWRDEAGESLAGFVNDMARSFRGIRSVSAASYAALIQELTQGIDIRPRYGLHPRLFIWGPLEARLQQVDLMILGGLNEGVWPGEIPADPWLSRPMRKSFGLPAPERKIGLAAHDFQQAMGAPRVVLTRAQRVGGKPSVPSRWLLRLDAFLRAVGIVEPIEGASIYRGWQARLDLPATPPQPLARPAPRPGVKYRPHQLSVTQIETWMRDPYALYARHILKLRALEPLDQEPGVADLGSLFHDILDRFVKEVGLPLPPDAMARLLTLGEESFAKAMARPAVWAFWWPRFCQMAEWFVAEMMIRQVRIAETATEARGKILINGISPAFTLTAKADRVDRLADGTMAIIDYKTGSMPSASEVALGFSPQLPLEAAIATRGGFANLAKGTVSQLEYWHLKGGRGGCAIAPVKAPDSRSAADPAQLAEDAYEGLVRLLTAFGREDAAYVARPRESFALGYNDYEHLSRHAEWASEVDE